MLTILVAAFVALQIGDGASTIVALRRPVLGEGNPIARRLFDGLGVVPAVVAMKVAAIGVAIGAVGSDLPRAAKITALATGCLFYVWAVADNVRLIRKARRAGQADHA